MSKMEYSLQGLLGSFICSLVDNPSIKFNVSGMDDSIRKSYKTSHSIGTIITISPSVRVIEMQLKFKNQNQILVAQGSCSLKCL